MAKAFPAATPSTGGFGRTSSRPIRGEVVTEARRDRAVEVDPALERLSWLMDSAIEIPGLKWRIGLDAVLGLIPGLGDTLTSLVSVYILAAASKHGVPKITLARMGLNLCIDYVVGAVPVVGDVFDAWFKANNRNMTLLRRAALAAPGEGRRAKRGDWLFVGGVIACVLLVLAAAVLGAIYLAAALIREVGQLF